LPSCKRTVEKRGLGRNTANPGGGAGGCQPKRLTENLSAKAAKSSQYLDTKNPQHKLFMGGEAMGGGEGDGAGSHETRKK